MNQKIISFSKAKTEILDKELKKEHSRELTKIALTSNSLTEYAVMSSLYKLGEASNKIANDSEKRLKYKNIYRH